MALHEDDRRRAELIGRIAHLNPFVPLRIELEREVLGSDFIEEGADWNLRHGHEGTPPNVTTLLGVAEDILSRCKACAPSERVWVEDLILFVLYQRHREGFDRTMAQALEGKAPSAVGSLYDALKKDALELQGTTGLQWNEETLAHAFALFFQIRRAFANIFQWIIGVSDPAASLRAQVWHSIFTHDLRRYRAALFERMSDFTTLVAGPSGTGKELVARAIGLSRYVPFDPESRSFRYDFAGSFSSLNLSALSPTLIESELFGHKRGSFTGAVGDRIGWLESCPPCGTVFLDEIGELDLAIQVKLLRVLESRSFSRLGETKVRHFQGKVIVATNRDLDREMRAGRFRRDLYYRLNSDMVVTPSLACRIQDAQEELTHLVSFLCSRLMGGQSEGLVSEVLAWIRHGLGAGYSWPGNVRELEQCVRNVMIRGEYHPAAEEGEDDERGPWERFVSVMRRCELSAEEVLKAYASWVYRAEGTYEGAARVLGLDRRTVKAKVREGRFG